MNRSTTSSVFTYKHSLNSRIADGGVVIDIDDSNVIIGFIIGSPPSRNHKKIHETVDGVWFIFSIKVEDTVNGFKVDTDRSLLAESDPF